MWERSRERSPTTPPAYLQPRCSQVLHPHAQLHTAPWALRRVSSGSNSVEELGQFLRPRLARLRPAGRRCASSPPSRGVPGCRRCRETQLSGTNEAPRESCC